jgi:hypothetical protein
VKTASYLAAFIILVLVVSLSYVNSLQAQNIEPISGQAQSVVDYLAAKGFDVTFVYFGSNSTLTFGTEDCAVVVMRTFEHVKNFKFTATQEDQFREGNKSLSLAYPNAEVFEVIIFEDLNVDGVPDGTHGIYYHAVSGGTYGGRSGGDSGLYSDYWIYAPRFVETGVPLVFPTPAPQTTPQPTATPSSTGISVEAQMVVDYLASKGFKVTFVYFGSNLTLTYGTEDCALVVMPTYEHVKNFQFTATHEAQFREGNKSLSLAYPNAEIFSIFLFEDLDKNGIPDNWPQSSAYHSVSGGTYGGRSSTTFYSEYWVNAYKYTPSGEPKPTPTPSPTPNGIPTTEPSPSTPLQVNDNFQIESNSTVSSIAYNSTAKEIRFQVSGETNTSGYIKITIAKTFMPAPDINVFIDKNKTDCTISSNGDFWLVVFTYKHSTHQVVIASQEVNQNQNVSATPEWLWQITTVGVAFAVIIGVSVVVWLGKSNQDTVKLEVP